MNLKFLDLLLLLFLGLKLSRSIDWPWWCVFIPLYVQLLVAVVNAANSKE